MKAHQILLRFLIAFFVLLLAATAVTAEEPGTHYRMQVRVDPSAHRLQAEAWVQNPSSSQFSLNQTFSIQEISADGKAVSFHRDPASLSNVVIEASATHELHLKYEGEIRDVVQGVNLIGPDLVELALYCTWFPRFNGAGDFTFELAADLPQNFLTTTNGQQTSRKVQGGRLITQWTSYRPGFDMVLLASPKLRQIGTDSQGAHVEMYYYQLPSNTIKTGIGNLASAMSRLSSIYGPPKVKGTLRFAYSPRNGWGYSRIPLFIVSEQYALQRLQGNNGPAQDFIGNCHELAHFWWNIVDMATPNDWINEGLAEYSAFRVAEEMFGGGFAKKRIAEYRQHSAESKTGSAIAETENASPDRYVNRYEKTTLMFLEARRRFGQASLDNCLKAFYTRFAGTHQATTELFLQQVRQSMGAEAEAFFREELYRRTPVSPSVKTAAVDGAR